MFNGKLDQLEIGAMYNWTAANGEKCKLIQIDQVFPDGCAKITVLHKGTLYSAASGQLYIENEGME